VRSVIVLFLKELRIGESWRSSPESLVWGLLIEY
jgi:hypothetical protein